MKQNPPLRKLSRMTYVWYMPTPWATLQSFIREGSAPRFNPSPFCIPFWQKSYPFHIPLIKKRYAFHILSYLTGVLWIDRQKRKSSCHFHVVLNKLNDTAIRCVCSLKKKLDNRFPYLFRYLNLWNPYRFTGVLKLRDNISFTIQPLLGQTLSRGFAKIAFKHL